MQFPQKTELRPEEEKQAPGEGQKGGKFPKHAAIFDLDGTLLDTLHDLSNSLNKALKTLGFPGHTLEEYRQMVGNGISRLTFVSLPEEERNEENALEVRKIFKKDYALHQLDLTAPYPGIIELVEGLRARGWPLGVLSNKDHENTLAVVEHFFPQCFQVILGSSPDRPPKPDTKGALEARALLGTKPQNIFFFGDSDVDMVLAKASGFVAVGVSWGFRKREVILKAGAEVVLDAPSDFFPFLREKNVW
jgi:phosphoglycolate phosphatase